MPFTLSAFKTKITLVTRCCELIIQIFHCFVWYISSPASFSSLVSLWLQHLPVSLYLSALRWLAFPGDYSHASMASQSERFRLCPALVILGNCSGATYWGHKSDHSPCVSHSSNTCSLIINTNPNF